ncbi:MAG: tRNA (adenosine(37)-N6)-threonylcarbamoyltransferase complex ATPase subunit type 1 TsaE [Phycisphaerales bacterium]|nr:tRNA (adenosine(37)-N6)-threonylcarbamoyltransferase complex ATPase subunit type 1 TsaE [Phycisphaerales bacterium]
MAKEATGLDATASVARRLARLLRPGDIVRLSGQLGAGKTTLVRHLAVALGVEPGLVSSPTYVLMNEYPIPASDQPDAAAEPRASVIVHIDAYRLASAEDLESTGWDTLKGDEIVLIEWAERVDEALPKEAATIRITPTGESSRRIEIDAPASWGERPEAAVLIRDDTVCPVTGRPVSAETPSWPFADEQARMVDLHRWFSGGYSVSRPIEERDLDLSD